MKAYYAARAREYEQIYAKPERQTDLRVLEALIPRLLADRHILEVACGTGYWTQFLAGTASHVLATDVNAEVLEVATQKGLPPDQVRFQVEDAYALALPPQTPTSPHTPNPAGDAPPAALPTSSGFDAAFAGFWWSHLTRQDQLRFLSALQTRLKPGARVVLLDNRFVPGSSTPISERDADGNTYQLRPLTDGSVHKVLKNFPEEAELVNATQAFGPAFHYQALPHFWVFGFVMA